MATCNKAVILNGSTHKLLEPHILSRKNNNNTETEKPFFWEGPKKLYFTVYCELHVFRMLILYPQGMQNIKAFFEPTDTSVCHRIFEGNWKHNISYVTPNINELKRMVNFTNPKYDVEKLSEKLEDIAKMASIMANEIDYVIVTLGDRGLVICSKRSATDPLLTKPETQNRKSDPVLGRHYPVKKLTNVPNVSGAGDCFASGMIHAMLKGLSEELCISVAFEAAKRSLQCKDAVPEIMFDDQHECWKQPAKYVKVL